MICFSAHTQDEKIADRLDQYELNHCALANRWNGPLERDKKSASRRQSTQVKMKEIDLSRKKFEDLEKKSLDLNTKRIKSLERSKEIKARLEEIRNELTLYSKISTIATNLKQERVKLNCENSQEITNRKAWVLEDANTKQEMQELKNNELKNVRVYNSRANSVASSSRLGNSTTTTPAGSPEKQPPASPQHQPMDIIYEDFDIPLALASTSGFNDHPVPNSPQYELEETHTLANPSPWQAVSSEPSTQMEEMDLELDEDLAQILREHAYTESIAIMDRFLELFPPIE
jgi:hypothetical protein